MSLCRVDISPLSSSLEIVNKSIFSRTQMFRRTLIKIRSAARYRLLGITFRPYVARPSSGNPPCHEHALMLLRVMVNGFVNGDSDGVRLYNRIGDVFFYRDGYRLLDGYRYVLLHGIRHLLLYRDRHCFHNLYGDVLRYGDMNGIGLRNGNRYRMWHGYRH